MDPNKIPLKKRAKLAVLKLSYEVPELSDDPYASLIFAILEQSIESAAVVIPPERNDVRGNSHYKANRNKAIDDKRKAVNFLKGEMRYVEAIGISADYVRRVLETLQIPLEHEVPNVSASK